MYCPLDASQHEDCRLAAVSDCTHGELSTQSSGCFGVSVRSVVQVAMARMLACLWKSGVKQKLLRSISNGASCEINNSARSQSGLLV